PYFIEIVDKAWLGTLASRSNRPGHLDERAAVAIEGCKKVDNTRFALSLEHAIDRACAMLANSGSGELGAVAADADERARQHRLVRFRQRDNLGGMGEVIPGKGNEIWLPLGEHAVIIGMALDLQVDNFYLMLSAPRSFCDQLKPQRFKPQED